MRVVELFAGVGGFREGLERWEGSPFKTVWFNQWEPGKSDRSQHAWRVYCDAFGLEPEAERARRTNVDIGKVSREQIPDHDLLVGGFPCQDYSVAKTLGAAHGLVGKKGVLWWDIHRLLAGGIDAGAPTKYLLLENVDRLLKSPATRRGRDFAIMLSSLAQLGYAAEWRIINAADYGMPQRRRRVYIMAYLQGTPEHEELVRDPSSWVLGAGILGSAHKIAVDSRERQAGFSLPPPEVVSQSFDAGGAISPFRDAGASWPSRDGLVAEVVTMKTNPVYDGERMTLRHALDTEEPSQDSGLFIADSALEAWRYLKGAKAEPRMSKSGFQYQYTEGPVAFPDPLDKPSRTLITGEGGSAPSRFKHVIQVGERYRRLTPTELERLNGFEPGHTKAASPSQRAFFMGNALVVGIVRNIGQEWAKRFKQRS